MSEVSEKIELSVENVRKIFGVGDGFIKKVERDFDVIVTDRNGAVYVRGDTGNVSRAIHVLKDLSVYSDKGNEIEEQNVDYAISMEKENTSDVLGELDKDVICHTVNGKPIKAKTIGQKKYVDAIRDHMITFGTGPAGTGKTYLAMAMAIMAFKNEEVSRIILTRPAIEAGEKLGFLPGDLQSKVDPYLRPLYDALYQIMGAESFLRNMEKGLI